MQNEEQRTSSAWQACKGLLHNPYYQKGLDSGFWKRFCKNRFGFYGAICLVVITLMCFLVPLITPYDYGEQDLSMAGQGPSSEHWLGTDLLGRDLLSRLLYGGRISFLVGLTASLISLTIGVTYGAVAGWVGGRVDRLMMRVIDIIYSLPYTIFVVILMVFIGRGLLPLFLAIGVVEWLMMARIVRGQVMQVKNLAFVQASRTLGQPFVGIVRKHVLPNIATVTVVCLTLTIPNVMLLESFISFLGLGVQPPVTSWGDLIKEGALSMETNPWLIIFPSLFLSLTLFSLNFVGDALRDMLDPKRN